jgi:translation initiation factor 2B subunit (eIF-2B alpha/beta/delta family)
MIFIQIYIFIYSKKMDHKKLEAIPSIVAFKKMLRKKEYKNSTEIGIKTANLYAELIKSIWRDFNDLSNLLDVLRELGKSFISMDPLQFSVGNIIKRVINKFLISQHKIINSFIQLYFTIYFKI